MIPPRHKIVELTFKRKELLYDCKNYGYIESDVMKTDDEHDRHQVADIGEEGNVDRVTRVLNLAMAVCTELCYPYSKVAVPEPSNSNEAEVVMQTDDVLQNPEEYVLRLLVPDDFSQTTVNLLNHQIHELLVCRVMEDWLSITNTKKAEVWGNKAETAEDAIRKALDVRIKRVRRTLTPFG